MSNQEITGEMVKELRERTGVGMGKCKEALVIAKGDMDLAIANLRKAGMASAVKKEGRETKEGVIKVHDDGKKIALVQVNAETDFVVKNEAFQEFVQFLAQEACHFSPKSLEEFLKLKTTKDPKVTIDEWRAIVMQKLGENIQIKRISVLATNPHSSFGIYSHMGGKLVTLVEIEGSDQERDLAKEIAMHVAAEAPEYLLPHEIPAHIVEQEKEIARAQIKGKPDHIIEKIVEGKLKAYYDQVCLLHQHFVKNPEMTIHDLVEKRGKEKGKALKLVRFIRWKVSE